MPGFRWGSFAGGIGEGIEQGQEIRERYRKMAEEQRANTVDAIAAQAMEALDQGASPQTTPPLPVMTNVAIPGAKPMPAGPAAPPGATMAPPPGPGAGAAPPPGGAGPPGANTPAPPPPPAAPPGMAIAPAAAAPNKGAGPPGGAGGDPNAQIMQQVAQARQQQQAQLKSMYAAVMKVGGPQMKGHPELAYRAVSQMIEQSDKLGSSDKNFLTMENNLLRDQISMFRAYSGAAQGEQKIGIAQEALELKQTAEAAREDYDNKRIDTQRYISDENYKRAIDVARMNAESRETVGAGHDAASRYRTDNPPSGGVDTQGGGPAVREAEARVKRIKDDMAAYRQSQGTGGLNPNDPTWVQLQKKLGEANDLLQKAQAMPRPRKTTGATAGATAGGRPGSSAKNPVKPASKAEAMKLPPGTWFQDPAGNILQKH